MAVGDAAEAYGYPLVPDTGESGRVRWGGLEINRTRDMIAQVAVNVPSGPVFARVAAGITSGSADPSGGANGDIYFQIIG